MQHFELKTFFITFIIYTTMKKTVILLLFFLAMLTSCHKKGITLFAGDYSYKMSGSVELTPAEGSSLEPIQLDITNEIGNLQISKLDKEDGSVMVVMNALNGGLSTATAYCDGKEIVFDEFEHRLKLTNIASGINTNSVVSVEAEGAMYDDNTIILNVSFSGEQTYLGNTYTIQGDDITMVAYRNN